MTELSYHQTSILEILKQHIGEQRPITGRKLADLIGLKPRFSGMEGADLRNLIHSLRMSGFPILADTRGYWYAKTKEELSKCIVGLENRIKSIKQARDGLNNSFSKVGFIDIPIISEDEKLKTMSQAGIFG